MAAPTFTITQGDRAPTLRVTCKDASGAAVDLTNATSVTFTMRNASDGTVKINAAAGTFVNPRTSGVVDYAWGATDTNTVGTYNGKFTVTWADGTKTSFPTDQVTANNYIVVNVVDDAGTVG